MLKAVFQRCNVELLLFFTLAPAIVSEKSLLLPITVLLGFSDFSNFKYLLRCLLSMYTFNISPLLLLQKNRVLVLT